MDWNIAIIGPTGSGKTSAIRAISEIEVLDTEVQTRPIPAAAAAIAKSTTAAMDLGVMELGSGVKLRLFGAPGQERFGFMQDIVLGQAKGAVLTIDHRRATRLQDLQTYWHAVQAQPMDLPVVVAVTHAEKYLDRDLALYQQFFLQRSPCTCSLCQPPVLWCDAREPRDVAVVMLVMSALLESLQIYPDSVLHQRMSPAIPAPTSPNQR